MLVAGQIMLRIFFCTRALAQHVITHTHLRQATGFHGVNFIGIAAFDGLVNALAQYKLTAQQLQGSDRGTHHSARTQAGDEA